MSVDLRGFDYPLQPLRTRQQWQLDATNGRLAGVLRELAQVQARRDVLWAEIAACADMVSNQTRSHWNSERHALSLRWLAQRRQALQALDDDLGALRHRRTDLVAQYLDCQQRLTVIDQHRSGVLREFSRVASARAATQADRDWLTRTPPSRP